MQSNRRAFSLVELSIVLVILGLLVGGVLSGQSLIRAAELRSVSAEYQRYYAAVGAFRDKYFAAPGDFRDATKFWTRQAATADCITNSSAAVSTPGACDGDGGGTIGTSAASSAGESMQFWRHLALAGLIEGSYTGLAAAGATDAQAIGTNVPRARITNASWHIQGIGVYAGDASAYAIDYGNAWWFATATAGAVLKPEEAWNIDTKIDDGKPASGRVIARFWNNACSVADDGTSANNDLIASYKLSDSTIQCSLFFTKIF